MSKQQHMNIKSEGRWTQSQAGVQKSSVKQEDEVYIVCLKDPVKLIL